MTPEQIENVTKWIKALRSGEFKQGDGFLKAYRLNEDGTQTSDISYCCLGVLSEIQKVPSSLLDDDGAHVFEYYFQDERQSVRCREYPSVEWFKNITGFTDDANGWLWNDGEHEIDLAELNDNGYTFDQIANVIEKKLLTHSK